MSGELVNGMTHKWAKAVKPKSTSFDSFVQSGDSGGPVFSIQFSGNLFRGRGPFTYKWVAVGSVRGNIPAQNGALLMTRANKYSEMDLQILTQP